MNKAEIAKLFKRFKRYYPFDVDEEKVNDWYRTLKHVPFEQADANFDRYLMDPANKFAPHPGILTQALVSDKTTYDQLWMDAQHYFALLEHWQRKSGPPSPEVKERMRQLAERSAARTSTTGSI